MAARRRSSALAALALLALLALAAAAPDAAKAKESEQGFLARILGSSSNAGVAFFNSVTMIIATELGDKTFCIAAVMAMRYNRAFVFGGALGALIVMTILSVAIGAVMPQLLSRVYTHYAAALLFVYFGFKLLKEAREMSGSGDHDELRETEQELGIGGSSAASPSGAEGGAGSDGAAGAAAGGGSAPSSLLVGGDGAQGAPGGGSGATAASAASSELVTSSRDVEAGAGDDADPSGKSTANKPKGAVTVGALPRLLHYAKKDWGVITQAFTLTFLAEWGDRSQIASIAMGAAQDPVGITVGAIVGHALCTGLAVLGGRVLAARISERTVATGGGILFLLFAAHSLITGPEQ